MRGISHKIGGNRRVRKKWTTRRGEMTCQGHGHDKNYVAVASVAQLAEQLTLNQLVLGSSPSRGTIPSSTYENQTLLQSGE